MKNGRDKLPPTLRQSGRSAAGIVSAVAALALATTLAGCANSGGNAFPQTAPTPPASPVPVVQPDAGPRQLPDLQRQKIADAVDTPEFQAAAGTAQSSQLPGVSHDPRILDSNPFAPSTPSTGPAAAPAARAPSTPVARGVGGYKSFEFPFPENNFLMTVAVWISEDPAGNLLAQLQIFISPAALLIVLETGIAAPSDGDKIDIKTRPPPDDKTPPDDDDDDKTPKPISDKTPDCPAGSLGPDGKPVAELTRRLRMSAREGDAEKVCEWLRRGAQIDDTQNGDGESIEESILHEAVRGGHLAAARVLLANGAKPNQRKEGRGPSPLDVAAQKDFAEIAAALRAAGGKCFLETGPLCEGTPTAVTPPVTVAPPVAEIPECDAGNSPQARKFQVRLSPPIFPYWQRPETKQEELNRELRLAIFSTTNDNWGPAKRDEICEWIRRGADINHQNPRIGLFGKVLHQMSRSWFAFPPRGALSGSRYEELAEFLIKNGADVNAKTSNGWTPLHAAASMTDHSINSSFIHSHAFKLMKVLLRHGADVNARTETTSITPLHLAILGEPFIVDDVLGLLLESGADIDAKDDFKGRTPLHYAAEYGRVSAVDFLVQRGAKISMEDDNGKTPLELATTAYWNSERNIYVLEVFTHLREKLENLESVMALLREAEKIQTPTVVASRDADLGDGSGLATRFGNSFLAGGAFGDLFGAGRGEGVSHFSRLNSLMRAGDSSGGAGGSAWDWEMESRLGRLWFSDGSRGDLGFGAGGAAGRLGDEMVRSPFAGLSGSGLAAGGEADLRGHGKFRLAAFGAHGRRDLFGGGSDSAWADWAARGMGAGRALAAAEGLSGLAENGWRSGGALAELHLAGGLGEFAVQAGAVGESESWLSGVSRGGGDLSGLRARTAFAGVSGLAELAGGWRLRGSAHWGRSRARSDGILRRGDSWASSYSAGLERGGWLRTGDGFVLRVSQPLRVERWDLELAGADGHGVRRSGSGPSGRQLDADAAYQLPLSGGGWLLLSAGVRSESGHARDSGLAGAALFSLEREF